MGAGRADLAAGSPAGEDPADAARRRFWRAVRPRASRSQLVVALICALLGFGAAVQVRQAQDQSLSSLRQSDLLIVLDNVTQESARLDDEAAQLQQTLEELRNDPAGSPAAREAAQDRLNVLGILAGTVPATGPGITMTVTDPQHAVDATDLLETVQELRDAGAEAMQIGPARIVASTSFVDSPQGVLIDGTLVTPSYEFTVIGDTQTLAAALKIPGGVVEALRSKNAETVITSATEVRVTALRPVTNGQYARPAQPGS